jgi:hypothetical protein
LAFYSRLQGERTPLQDRGISRQVSISRVHSTV